MVTMSSFDGANGTTTTPPPAPTMITTVPPKPRINTVRHWRVLRNALVSKTRDEVNDSTASSVSTEFFPQFSSELCTLSSTLVPAVTNFEWHAYTIPKGAVSKRVFVHEKNKRQKVSLTDLFSHKLNQGVDNTGNIRTWPSEQILLSHLLRSETCRSLTVAKGASLNCCELGAGMAGLASLGLMAHNSDSIQHMLVTDGNPQCVDNLKICIQANQSQRVMSTAMKTELLRWDRTAQFPPSQLRQYDLVFASDCLFFEEFHEDLAYTINALLRPATGVCFLLQPSRNGSMERFLAIASSSPYNLHIRVIRDYDESILRKHEALITAKKLEYVPDVHFPVLLEVRSIR